MRARNRTLQQALPGSSSAATDASAAVDRTLRMGRVSGCLFQKMPQFTVAPQVYYAPLMILADTVAPELTLYLDAVSRFSVRAYIDRAFVDGT